MIKRLLPFLLLLFPIGILAGSAHAQGTTKVVGTCGTQTYVAGTMQYPTQDTTGAACGSGGGGGGGNNSVGVNNATAPGSSTQIGGTNGSNLVPIQVTTSGALQPPTAASGKETYTDVSITTATNTQLVAANANRIGIEVQCAGGPVKVSMVGGTLTSVAQGTGPGGTILPTANTLYIPSMASLTAVTAYQSTGSPVVCTVTEYVK